MDQMHPMALVPAAQVDTVVTNRRMLMVEISANLKYHLNKGTVIEATAALETLLTNSDVDLSLPMSYVAPPYRAQYLRFGEAAMKYLKVPESRGPDHVFDGVFCFFTPDTAHCAKGETLWTLELIFISKRQDRNYGHIALLGETDRGSTTVGEWLTGVLAAVDAKPLDEFHRPMHAAVSYVARVFLYMALKQARVMEHPEYDEALRRAAGLGERNAARGAGEQTHAQARFQRQHGVAQRRTRQAHLRRGTGEASLARDHHEGLQVIEVFFGHW